MKDMLKLGIFLFVVSAIAAAALSMTYMVTAPRIEAQKLESIAASLRESCLPGANNITEKKMGATAYYVGYDKSGKVYGYAFRVFPKGYGGQIDMLVGIKNDGKVDGVKIMSLSETPGLGTQTNTPKFLAQFIGKTIKSKLKAKQDIDAISGATISSQAVSNGVKEALLLFSRI